MREHHLNTWHGDFEAINKGLMTAIIRFDDKEYVPGDILCFKEHDTETNEYSGRMLAGTITMTKVGWGLQAGYILLIFKI